MRDRVAVPSYFYFFAGAQDLTIPLTEYQKML